MIVPKGGGTKSRDIGLVDLLWKAISGIINHWILSSIQVHDDLHGFLAGRGTGTTTIKAKMIQQIIATRETFPHSIFLDLRKAYDALDMNHCLDILAGYGVEPRMLHILQFYWACLHMAAKAGGHYGPVFQSHCGVNQG